MKKRIILLIPATMLFLLYSCSNTLMQNVQEKIALDDYGAPKEFSTFSLLTNSKTEISGIQISLDEENAAISVTVPFGTDITGLIAVFGISGGNVTVGDTEQVSSETINDFTGGLTYRITADDGTIREYTINITILPNTEKDITGFSFQATDNTALDNNISSIIDGTGIALTVPYLTDVTTLAATFTTTGETVAIGETIQESGMTVNDFTNPVTYRVTAMDGSFQDYTVSVTVNIPTSKELTSFVFKAENNPGLTEDAIGDITGTDITIEVPSGTDISGLVASFVSTGISVAVSEIEQLNEETANSFENSVVYRVTAADTSHTDYTIIVIYRYTLSYDGNGNTGGITPSEPVTGISGDGFSVSVNTFEKTGYSFTGWNTQTDGEGESYNPETSITFDSGDITLYAQWQINTYTISFNGNGENSGVPPAAEYDYNTSINLPAAMNRTNYIFTGWNTRSDGGGISLNAESEYTVTENQTFYAQWLRVYSVTYDSNGADSGDVPEDPEQYLSNSSVTVLGNTGNLVRAEYIFLGWNTVFDGSGIPRNPGTSFVITNSNVILYARWTQETTYTVSFDTQGGSSVSSQTIIEDSYAAEPAAPVRTGYDFGGWFKEAGCYTEHIFESDAVTSNITLYAKWTIITYDVTFDSQGGTTVGSQIIDHGDTIAEPSDPIRTGYNFGGWYTEPEFISLWNFSTAVTEDVFLYAKWTIKTYTVTFNSQSGSTVDLQTIDHGSLVNEPEDPIRTGYTFGGWYKESGCITSWDFASETITSIVTIYAKWTINTYTVTFDSLGGSSVGSQNIDHGNTATEPTAPTRTGYTFGGWHTDSECTTSWNFTTAVTGILTLYTKWTLNSYDVTFDSQDGSTVDTQNIDHGGLVTEPTDPTRTGYTFGGWYKESGCITAWGFSTDTVTSEVTIYAKWTIISYPVDFESNGGTSISSQNIDHGGTVSEPTDPTRTGYAFGDWHSDEELTTAWNFSTGVTETMTLYAKWTAVDYDLTFNSNYDTPTTYTQTFTFDTPEALDTNAFSRTGHSFAGWAESAGGTVVYNNGDSYTMTTEGATLYAKWTVNDYDLTFDSNYGTPTTYTQPFTFGTTDSLDPNTFDYSEHNFVGWNTNKTGTGTDYVNQDSYTMVTEGATLYAQWMPVYSITFNINDNVATGSTATQYIQQGETESLNLEGYYKRGWSMPGWALTSGGGVAYGNGENYTMGSSNVTLYAVWEPPSEYSLGDWGPGDGYIFFDDYDHGSIDIPNARYLEAAPYANRFSDTWGTMGVNTSADGQAIGTGNSNTNHLKGLNMSGSAFEYLEDDYRYGGKDDWFLPSLEEWHELRQVLYIDLDLGNYNYWANCWTSSEGDSNHAWNCFVGTDSQGYKDKDESWHCFPIRQF